METLEGSLLRGVLRKPENTTVVRSEVTGAAKDKGCVFLDAADRSGVLIYYD